jgi:hypothetical protein
VRPRLINEARVPRAWHVSPALGGGWTVTERRGTTVHLFDAQLRPVASVAVPLEQAPHSARAGGGLIVAGDEHDVAAVGVDGRVWWRNSWEAYAGRPTGGAAFDLDADGVLWVGLGWPAEIVLVDAATGAEFDRLPARLADDDDDDDDADDRPETSPDGGRLLTAETNGWLSVWDAADGAMLARRHLADVPARPPYLDALDFLDLNRAVFVTDELVLVAVCPDELPGDAEDHLLLSSGGLRCRSRVRYPHLMRAGSVHSAPAPGRWLTQDDDVLRLWQLDGRLDDEPLPGQLALV